MSDISKLKVGGTVYSVKDPKARMTISTSTLLAASWSNASYSFETSYPNASYDLMIEINGDSCTADQCKAWDAAQIKGSPTKNSIKAMGTVPTINIPIIIKYTAK